MRICGILDLAPAGERVIEVVHERPRDRLGRAERRREAVERQAFHVVGRQFALGNEAVGILEDLVPAPSKQAGEHEVRAHEATDVAVTHALGGAQPSL